MPRPEPRQKLYIVPDAEHRKCASCRHGEWTQRFQILCCLDATVHAPGDKVCSDYVDFEEKERYGGE